jgi:uncharacterized protein YjiS (DUF1127 family)
MYHQELLSKTSGRPDSTWAIVRDFVLWALRSYRQRQRYRAAVRSLQAMDARMLKDIGLDASEIESVVYRCDSERRSAHQRFDRRDF